MIRTETGINQHIMKRIPATYRESTVSRLVESYNNPRLKDDEAGYLNADHIEVLRRESAITVWDEYAPPKIIPGIGTLRRIGIETEQGYTYDTLVGIPERPECEIPVIGTTAWTTSLRGHNEHLVRNLVRAGNYVMYVGAEGSYVSSDPPRPKTPISLANSAATVLNFSYHMTQELRARGHAVDPELRFGLGESRGGMVAVGIDALAASFGQDVLFSDEVAPCLPKKLESIAEIARFAEQIAREPKEIYKLLGSLTLSRLRYYPYTLDVRLDCLRQQAVIGGALFSGEAGALARKRPGRTLKHVTVFDRDFASMNKTWETIYLDDPQVVISGEPGSHMTLAHLETLKKTLARNKAAQHCANQSLWFTKDTVIGLAQQLTDRQHPLDPSDMGPYRQSA